MIKVWLELHEFTVQKVVTTAYVFRGAGVYPYWIAARKLLRVGCHGEGILSFVGAPRLTIVTEEDEAI